MRFNTMGTQLSKPVKTCLGILVVLVIIVGFGLYQFFGSLATYSYKEGRCTITSKSLSHYTRHYTTSHTTGSGKHKHTYYTHHTEEVYTPHFSFTLHTTDNQSYETSGYSWNDAS